MVSFKEIQFNKKEAVYPQLVSYVKKQILIGSVENNEELPKFVVTILKRMILPLFPLKTVCRMMWLIRYWKMRVSYVQYLM